MDIAAGFMTARKVPDGLDAAFGWFNISGVGQFGEGACLRRVQVNHARYRRSAFHARVQVFYATEICIELELRGLVATAGTGRKLRQRLRQRWQRPGGRQGTVGLVISPHSLRTVGKPAGDRDRRVIGCYQARV